MCVCMVCAYLSVCMCAYVCVCSYFTPFVTMVNITVYSFNFTKSDCFPSSRRYPSSSFPHTLRV